MSALSALRRAGVLAAFGAFVAISCGSETIDLLPPEPPGSAGGVTAGGGATHREGGAGVPGPEGGAGGGDGAQGEAGGGACNELGCDGFWEGYEPCQRDEHCPDRWRCVALFGGVCVECFEHAQCRQGFNCDFSVGRCAPACQGGRDCSGGRVCHPLLSICVQCATDGDCASDGETRRCAVGGRCVECLQDDDCDEGSKNVCAGSRCTECVSDWHCAPDRRCDVARGRCE